MLNQWQKMKLGVKSGLAKTLSVLENFKHAFVKKLAYSKMFFSDENKKPTKGLSKTMATGKDVDSYNYDRRDYEYMQSLSAAILEHAPKKMSRVLYAWVITIFILIVWASFAEIDEITRGSGDVVASGDNKVIQNLEGGIVDEILVQEGEAVKANQILIKLTNTKSSTQLQSQNVRFYELKARSVRLKAESSGKPFVKGQDHSQAYKKFLALEEELYYANRADFTEQDVVVKEQIIQKKHEYRETEARIKHLKKALTLIKEEVTMTEPMVQEGIKSKIDFLKLRREHNDVEQKYTSARLNLPSIYSQITELRGKRKEQRFAFKNKAKKELNEVLAEMERISLDKNILSDQVNRTYVRSPVDGIVQKLYVKTKGGVVRPGDDIIEIVPTNDKLLLEVKIKPSDIAFLHPGAKAMVKFSAYDFAIHGGLEGQITRISPDTVSDEKDGTYYLVYIKTDQSFLGSIKNPLEVIPGMLVDVDIITGQKSIMEYILKPILKSKQYVFSER